MSDKKKASGNDECCGGGGGGCGCGGGGHGHHHGHAHDHDHGHDHGHHHSHEGEMHPNQLEPPHEVFHDGNAGEIIRGWITNGSLALSLHAMAFGKAEVWGHVLAGTAAQVAAACSEMGHGEPLANLAEIRKALNADLDRAEQQLAAMAKKA